MIIERMSRLGHSFVGVRGGRIVFTAHTPRARTLAFKTWDEARRFCATAEGEGNNKKGDSEE